jgi:hypothetical protein
MCWKTLLVLVTAVSSTVVVIKCSVKADLYIFGQVLKNWAEFFRHAYASLCFAKAVIALKISSFFEWTVTFLPTLPPRFDNLDAAIDLNIPL